MSCLRPLSTSPPNLVPSAPVAARPAAEVPVAGALPRDGFSASAAAAPPAAAVVRVQSAVPDVDGILASGKRHEDLNLAITTAYTGMAPLVQSIIDPSGKNAGLPNWYAIAAYASRSAGQGMCVAHAMQKSLDESATTVGALLRFATHGVPGPAAAALTAAVAKQPTSPLQASQAASLALAATRGSHDGLMHFRDELQVLEPGVMAVTSRRLANMLWKAPGCSLHDKTAAVTRTLLNGLEFGNRAIFADIGAAGAAFLKFRQQNGGQVTPQQVLEQFSCDGSPRPDDAHLVFDRAVAQASGNEPLPTDFGAEFPQIAGDNRAMFPAAFALYEQAGRTADSRVRDRLVMYANVLLAWREQHDVAVSAFDAPAPPDEVSRHEIWRLMTPLVDLKTRAGVWSYVDYLGAHDDQGPFGHLLTPTVAKKSWADFNDRWPAILNSFDTAYANASALWPMPNPNPMKAIDEPV